MQVHFPDTLERLQCPWCSETVKRRDTLTRHVNEQHLGKKRGESWNERVLIVSDPPVRVAEYPPLKTTPAALHCKNGRADSYHAATSFLPTDAQRHDQNAPDVGRNSIDTCKRNGPSGPPALPRHLPSSSSIVSVSPPALPARVAPESYSAMGTSMQSFRPLYPNNDVHLGSAHSNRTSGDLGRLGGTSFHPTHHATSNRHAPYVYSPRGPTPTRTSFSPYAAQASGSSSHSATPLDSFVDSDEMGWCFSPRSFPDISPADVLESAVFSDS